MKMKLFFALMTALPLTTFAGGGSSIGPGICHYANVVCTTENSSKEGVVVCLFKDKTALVDADNQEGSTDSRFFKGVQLQSTQAGVLGAPQLYSGEGFELTVSSGIIHPATLNVPSMGLEDIKLKSCTFQN